MEYKTSWDPATDRIITIAWIGDETVGWSVPYKEWDIEAHQVHLDRANKYLKTHDLSKREAVA